MLNIGENVGEFEPLHTYGRNAKWYSSHGEQNGGSSKKKKIKDEK